MYARRALAATTVAVALLGSGPADAVTRYSLNGRNPRTLTYSGSLDGPAVPATAASQQQPLQPHVDDCTDTSCDLRELRLSLPRNVSSGRFHTTVILDPELQATLVLYNAEGEVIRQFEPYSGERAEDLTYRLDIHVERLARGNYTLALVDRAGMGSFAATIAWVAHPPDRR